MNLRSLLFRGRPLSFLALALLVQSPLSCGDSEGDAPDGPVGGGGAAQCEALGQRCLGGDSMGGALGGGAPVCRETSLSLQFEPVSGFDIDRGTDFVWIDDTRALFASSSGRIDLVEVKGEEAQIKKSWEIQEELFPEEACGLTNLLLSPDFEDKGFLYATLCSTTRVNRLYRYDLDLQGELDSPQVILETTLPKRTDEWHRFGSMGFEEDKKTLWIQSGDHFDAKLAQDLSVPMGKLLRIVPNTAPMEGGYEPAAGNLAELASQLGRGGAPSAEEIHPAIYAYGLRSPWRGTRDSRGFFFVGDVGLGTFEEVNLATGPGQNFGWNLDEGPCVEDCEERTSPIASYGRKSDDPYVFDDPLTEPATKRAIWVGEIYEEKKRDRYCGLMDKVVPFGDLFTGWVRGLSVNDEGDLTMDASIGHLPSVTAWRVGPDGYAYVLTLGGGFYRAVLSP